MLDEYCGSPFWNETLIWNTPSPRLTDCFKHTILIWIPCLFLWLWSSYHVYIAKSSRSKQIPLTILNISKFTVTFALITLQLVHLILKLITTESVLVDRIIVHSLVLKCATFALSLYLDFLSKKHGIRSSGVQFLFWFLLFVCQIAILQSADYSSGWTQEHVVHLIYTALISIQLVLNCWADAEPIYTENGRQSTEKSCPEPASSFLSRIFFFWFESLARKGHRKPLEFADLWELTPENCSKTLNPPFVDYWSKKLEKKKDSAENHVVPALNASFVRKNSLVDIEYKPDLSNGPSSVQDLSKSAASTSAPQKPGSIVAILCSSFGGTFLFGCLLKLVQDLLAFASPFILKKLIRHTQSDEEQWKGYFWAIILLFVTVAASLIGNQYFYKMYLIGLRVRTAVVGCIYRKALRISSGAREESTVGEIVNLMSVDAQKLTDMCPYLTIVWSAPLQISLSLYFLYDLLGPAVFAGLGVMILLIPISAIMGIKVKAYQSRQMKNKDKRIKLMNEILNGIKVLKLYAWEPPFEAQVNKIRDAEVKVLKESAFISAIAMFVWTCAPVLVAIVTFTTFILGSESNTMDAEKAFVSLSYFNIMRIPLNLLPMMLVSIVQSTVSIARINKYLNMEEVDEDAVQRHDSAEDPISIRDASFSWRMEEQETTLRKINLDVKEGQLVAIVGSVGSGKSSLLSAILGEIDKIGGSVHTKGTIAYVSQQAWIQNATVRENILFGRPYEAGKYEQVIEGCALRPDLEILPGGDMTEIGEKGINLSGGQKQRVSLARAVYNNAELYLFDDPLSAVDAHVGRLLFDKILGPSGLLSRKTRVLVTHGITYLPQMDQIIVLRDGEITETGNYTELLSRKGAFAEFLVQHIKTEDENEDSAILQDLEAALGKKKDELIGSGSEEKEKLENGNVVQERKGSTAKKEEPPPATRLIDEEAMEQGVVKWGVFLYYLRAIGWKLVALSVLLQLVFQALAVGSNVWLAIWADSASGAANGTREDLKKEYLCGYASFGVGQALSIFVATLAMSIGTLSASRLLHGNILHRVLRAPMWFFDTTPLGRIVNRLGKDIEVLDNAVSMSLTSWLKCLFNVAATMMVITYATPGFVLVVIPTAILYTLAQRFYIASSRQLRRLESVSRSPIYSHFTETLTGTTTIRAFGMQELFINKSESIVDQNQQCYFPSIISARFLAVFLETVGNLVIFFAAIFSVTYTDALTPGLVGLSLSYALQITHALNWLVETTNNVENNLVAVERLKEYNEISQEAEWESGAAKLPPAKSWPDSGQITFNNYQTKYRDELDIILNDLSFKIEPLERIGICGRTGAGKSSLALALFRLLEPTSGQIIIDGQDISHLGLHQLRRNLTVIPQDPIIFAGTIRSNLDPFALYSDDDLWHSLSLAHLMGFVKEKGAGLDYELVEGGENLSVGQRQLICLARALLRKSKILVLDEATAAIDLETDDLIQETIRTEFSDCTILTIAHRLNTIMDYTRILVLDQGMVQEFDTPANLLQNKNSLFYSLAKDAGLVT